jgi:predicted DNA-binding protein
MTQTAAAPVRRHLFNIRFSDDEQARLDALCAHLGVNAANLIRMLLKEKARELGIEGFATAADVPPAPPSRPRPKTKKR